MRALVARIQDGNDPVTALHLVAAPAVFTAGLIRLRQGQAPIPPDAGLGHAADILRMSGLPAEAAHVHALDAYLVTVADHGLNASTLASRVVASTRRTDIVGPGRDQRIEGPAARRRAGSGAGHAGCHRHGGQGVDVAGCGWRAATG